MRLICQSKEQDADTVEGERRGMNAMRKWKREGQRRRGRQNGKKNGKKSGGKREGPGRS